jgi:predicted PurR-regulated permease PerM
MDRPSAQRVEVMVSARTLLVLLAVGAIVALVLLPLGTLLSVFGAAVLALGLDLPGYWDDLTNSAAFQDIVSTGGVDDKVRNALKELAAGLPDAATAVIGIAGGVFGSFLSLITLTFLSLFLLMGAILAVPFAAVIKIVLREAGAPRRARMAALRDG